MIKDIIENAGIYFGLSEGIKKGLKYLTETDLVNLKPGKYQIEGDDLYAIAQGYKTLDKNEGKWEAHRKYIDIQYVLSGRERMGYSNTREMETVIPYDDQKDFAIFDGNGDMLEFGPGAFAVFYPEDAHMPCIEAEKSEEVRKVVVKVKIK